jgi:uncharacterized protein YigA (DUF484 family)
MTAEEIASYLKTHPEFFETYADLLADIYIPHPHGGRAISLTERQMLTLREKSQRVEDKLGELLQFGEENDAISGKLHRFALTLFAPPSLDALSRAIRERLLDIFAIPHAALRIWAGQPDEPGLVEFSEVSLELCSYVDKLPAPVCGHAADYGIRDWFGEDGPRLQSFALIPLRAEESFGLLALASEDPQRFYPEMGTLYLQRLGELVSAALLCHLSDAG